MTRSTVVRAAVICEPLGTAVGGFGGKLRTVPVQDLASTVIRALGERSRLPPESVDAGLPVTATGLQIDRRCGSGLQAVLHLPGPPGRRYRRPDPRAADPRDGPRDARYGLETMCIGGGQGLAAIFEQI
jgi:acetyl-CoA acetyltransferase